MLLIECYRPTEIALEKVPEILKLNTLKTQLIAPELRQPTALISPEKGIVDDEETNDFFDDRGSTRIFKNGGLTMHSSANFNFDGIQRQPLLTIVDPNTPLKTSN